MRPRRGRRIASERVARQRVRSAARNVLVGVGVACGLLAVGLLDRNTGAVEWLELRRDLAAARLRIAALRASIAAREAEAAALASDPLAQESAIRSDLRVARPGEWVVREADATSLRNP